MADEIQMGELGTYLTDLVEKEVQGRIETFDEVLHKRSMQLRDRLKAASPRDSGDYASGWRIKTAQRNHEKVRVIYNAKKPWLTYILEYGNHHQKAQPHIRRTVEDTVDEIIEELVSKI